MRPQCKCGCGISTLWLSKHRRWAMYAQGHYRSRRAYHDADWLQREYVDRRRTTWEIAADFGVGHSTILKAMRKHGLEARNRSESRSGRHLGSENPAWKGGVADWEYSPGWKVLARQIRDRDEWTCQGCGERRMRWGHGLHVHHIDGDKLNNDAGNLVSLCAGCHCHAHQKEVMA